LHVHGRGARTNACGRSFAVLSTRVLTVCLRLRLVVPRPIGACGRNFAMLSTQVSKVVLRLGGRVVECLK
jgi:hypothetical protein